ncbi:alpha/beta hydrolase [Pseudomonas huanghezhanensis]|uniref:alpha/beta hydrolase n=1 Tax=Pseudomonas huanghezhanensis TaxID=3002903 RepID=UPI0022857AB3|nr:alpha/beta hydrolase [Pseudomonas sp. BSw22131]
MKHEAFWLDAYDQSRLYVNAWVPVAGAKAVVMLSHGMTDHSGRYARLGAAMSAAGFALYAHDQRGHGRTAAHGLLGHFADQDGWDKVVGDLASLKDAIGKRHPGVPVFLLGHSMGSYVAQAYLLKHSAGVQGAILSGSNFRPLSFYRSAALLARFERWRQDAKGRSALIEFLSFGSFNKAFKPVRTPFDWLSRDPVEVDLYVKDPLCGFRCTNQFWVDLIGGLQHISQPGQLTHIDHGLPLLIIGGQCDPVSDGKRLNDLADAYKASGHQWVTLNLYPGARHELFNETNRDEVTRDLLAWLERALAQPRPRQPD